MQLILSALLDRNGILGLPRIAIGWQGWLGMGFLLAGTMLVTTR